MSKHYIAVGGDGYVTDGWSDGPHPEKPAGDAICIREDGGYQFRLAANGPENPPLAIMGIPLYKWDGTAVVARPQAEIDADIAALQTAALPTPEERLTALEDAMLSMLGVSNQ